MQTIRMKARTSADVYIIYAESKISKTTRVIEKKILDSWIAK